MAANPIIFVILFLVLAVGGGLAWYFLAGPGKDTPAVEVTPPADDTPILTSSNVITANPNGLDYISGSPTNYWKYTTDAADPDCATNWNYYAKDGKTLIGGNIPNITKLGSDKEWCAIKNPTPSTTVANPVGVNYISGSPATSWKYTTDPYDLECAKNWNYYSQDGKTLRAGYIQNVTKMGDTKDWCAKKV
jgi:hypothetical protein